MIGIFIAGLAVEAAIYLSRPFWRLRKILILPVIFMTLLPAVYFLAVNFLIFPILLLYVSIFRVFNQIKIIKNRTNEIYLKKTSKLSGINLGLVSLILVILSDEKLLGFEDLLLVTAAAQYMFAAVVYLSVNRNLRKMKVRANSKTYSDDELPTVTVAIPARNETSDLEDCLKSVLASDYPKLEILVLDDCSQDKTAEVIKSFAHKGVRFIKGEEPDDKWLPKNLAYQKLVSHSSGELVLFSGVDVRYSKSAIRSLVHELLNRKKSMASVLPKRYAGDILDRTIQIARYWWELALPRRFFNRPPVLSTCFIVKRKKLVKLGAFSAVKRSILPESYFAREIAKEDGYSFLRTSGDLEIQTKKRAGDSKNTAIRVKYPQLKRRPEIVMIIALIEIVLVFGPFILAISGIFTGFETMHYLALLAALVLILSQVKIISFISPDISLLSLVYLPLTTLIDVTLLYASMYQYEFSTVEWKGRNICIPVMRVYPHLPKVK